MNKQLPEGWVLAKLQDIVFPGETRNPSLSTEPYFLYVDIEALDNNVQKIVSPKKLPTDKAPGRARLVIRSNDVIFSLTRPYLKNIAVVPPELDNQIASTAYCVMRPENGISSNFVFYFVIRNDFIKSIPTYGDSPPAAHDDEFLAMEVPVPPTNEQNRIVALIEQQFSRLDSAIASLRSAQAKTKDLRASLLKSATKGELTKSWREINLASETGKQLLERILVERRVRWEEDQLAKMREKGKLLLDDSWKGKYKEPQWPNVENLPRLPEGWCWATVDQLSWHVTSGSRGWAQHYANSGSLFVRVGNFTRLSTKLDLQNSVFVKAPNSLEADRCRLQIGDLLITITADVGMVGTVDEHVLQWGEAFINQHVGLVRTVDPALTPFVALSLISEPMQAQIKNKQYGATKVGLGLEDLKSLAVPLPPLLEQEQIIAEIEKQFSELAKTEETVEHCLKRAEQERQSILSEAFAGLLVEQNSADEPASELLSRIREERKKRETEEKERKKEARKMINARKPRAYKNNRERIYYTLASAEEDLKPEEVFMRGGFEIEKQPESVEAFQVALTSLEAAGAVLEDHSTVTLRAKELPLEQIQMLLGEDASEKNEDSSNELEQEQEEESEQAYRQLSFLDEEN